MGRAFYMMLGILTGVLVGLLIAVILMKITKTNGNSRNEYDERQTAARGQAYKYGFFAFMIGDAVYAVLSTGFERLPLCAASAMGLIIILSVLVQISYCIWHDAYFSLNENQQRLKIIFALTGLVNLALSIRSICAGEMVVDGVLQISSLNLFCVGLFFAFLAELALKYRKGGAQEDEGEA